MYDVVIGRRLARSNALHILGFICDVGLLRWLVLVLVLVIVIVPTLCLFLRLHSGDPLCATYEFEHLRGRDGY